MGALDKEQRRVRLLPGPGIQLRETRDGTIISATGGGGGGWLHPFRVTLLAGRGAKIAPGTVNLIEPQIDGLPLSGDDRGRMPTLTWRKLNLDKDGRGYIALEATLDERWAITKDGLTVVQVAYFDSEDGTTAPANAGGPASIGGIPGLPGRKVRYPIARLLKRRSGQVLCRGCVQGDLAHRADVRGPDLARHFFWHSAA